MIKAIDLRKIEMTDEEYKYYQEITQKFTVNSTKGSEYFHDLFETNDNGFITIIHPRKTIPVEVLYFMLNLQQNQWLRSYDIRIKFIEEAILNGVNK